jgi:Domain of unknown function (DUF397)
MDVSSAIWRTSSYSGNNGGACVEAAAMRAAVLVRDSKDPLGPVLAFGARDWQQFADRIKSGA